jgi:cell division protein FtsN
MDNHAIEPGLQFVLDNRKLIILFAILIGICGGFFVLGYVEGKRQGVQQATQNASPTPSAHISESEETHDTAKATGNESAKGDLDWYRNIGKGGKKDAKLSEQAAEPAAPAVKPKANTAGKTAAAEIKNKRQPDRAIDTVAKISYSVQVGAFRQRKEAQVKAEALKAKGYKFAIEAPSAPSQLYLLKVGKFDSRADAVGMQLRLKKDGFTSFVKSN